MKNSFLIFISLLFAPFVVNADAQRQAISDGTTIAAIKSAFEKNLLGTNFEISSYAKSWNSYNPMSWVIDPNRKYRTISFSFIDRGGKKQSLSCSANIVSGYNYLVVHSCTGGDKSIGDYHRLSRVGYTGDSIIMNEVVSTSSDDTPAPANGVR